MFTLKTGSINQLSGETKIMQYPNACIQKNIDLTDFSASECSDIGLMSELCYVFLS